MLSRGGASVTAAGYILDELASTISLSELQHNSAVLIVMSHSLTP